MWQWQVTNEWFKSELVFGAYKPHRYIINIPDISGTSDIDEQHHKMIVSSWITTLDWKVSCDQSWSRIIFQAALIEDICKK